MIFVLCISNVQAAISIIGSGVASCGTYLKETEHRRFFISWVLGYLSGANSASAMPGDLLKGTDANAIEGAVTKYCQENPLQDIHDATDNIFFQLKKRMK